MKSRSNSPPRARRWSSTTWTQTPATETVTAIEAAGGRAVACVGSVTDENFGERFVQTAMDAFGGLDIIVNNAGYTWDSVIQKMTDEQWDAILDVHLKAPPFFHILRAAQPVISQLVKGAKESGQPVGCRKVVNISSLAGVGGNAGGQANYAAAKAGVIGLTKALAKEWGPLQRHGQQRRVRIDQDPSHRNTGRR